ncbi:MAG: hypothetical protein GY755_04500 [Chloroflexi bacterium]|nr:hypothetical protein [Chloroflexota bacterium]
MKKFYKSKTFWFGALLVAQGVAALFGFADFTPDDNTAEIVQIVVGSVQIGLRLITSKAIE